MKGAYICEALLLTLFISSGLLPICRLAFFKSSFVIESVHFLIIFPGIIAFKSISCRLMSVYHDNANRSQMSLIFLCSLSLSGRELTFIAIRDSTFGSKSFFPNSFTISYYNLFISISAASVHGPPSLIKSTIN